MGRRTYAEFTGGVDFIPVDLAAQHKRRRKPARCGELPHGNVNGAGADYMTGQLCGEPGLLRMVFAYLPAADVASIAQVHRDVALVARQHLRLSYRNLAQCLDEVFAPANGAPMDFLVLTQARKEVSRALRSGRMLPKALAGELTKAIEEEFFMFHGMTNLSPEYQYCATVMRALRCLRGCCVMEADESATHHKAYYSLCANGSPQERRDEACVSPLGKRAAPVGDSVKRRKLFFAADKASPGKSGEQFFAFEEARSAIYSSFTTQRARNFVNGCARALLIGQAAECICRIRAGDATPERVFREFSVLYGLQDRMRKLCELVDVINRHDNLPQIRAMGLVAFRQHLESDAYLMLTLLRRARYGADAARATEALTECHWMFQQLAMEDAAEALKRMIFEIEDGESGVAPGGGAAPGEGLVLGAEAFGSRELVYDISSCDFLKAKSLRSA